ncbi:MAG: hypothetical protein NTZ12_11950 [Candidatus Aminicenantes bacterium]|nr:hypothetical protein [Candidatus Aminicenantes bacterium]
MAVLMGWIFILFGVIFFFGGGGWSVISALFASRLASTQLMPQLVFASVGFAIWLLGMILVAIGLIGGKKKKILAKKIFETGVTAEATITFIEKNYGKLVNHKPVYSFVEYKYRDSGATEHLGSKSDVSSDLAVRLDLHVGGKVRIKYLKKNPGQNVLILPDPEAGKGHRH